MAAFISAVTGVPDNRTYPLAIVPISEGGHVLEVLLAIQQSARTNALAALARRPGRPLRRKDGIESPDSARGDSISKLRQERP